MTSSIVCVCASINSCAASANSSLVIKSMPEITFSTSVVNSSLVMKCILSIIALTSRNISSLMSGSTFLSRRSISYNLCSRYFILAVLNSNCLAGIVLFISCIVKPGYNINDVRAKILFIHSWTGYIIKCIYELNFFLVVNTHNH